MIDRQDLQQAREDLGRKLAALRKSRGLIQEALARQVHTTRSTLGMVERGRQVVDRIFWLQCDTLLEARGQLIAAYDGYRDLQSRFQVQQAQAAQRARWAAVSEPVITAGAAIAERYGEADASRSSRDRIGREQPEEGPTTRSGPSLAAEAETGRDTVARAATAAVLLAELRRHLLTPAQPTQGVAALPRVGEVRQRVAQVHSLYQRGNYAETVRALPDRLEQASLPARACTGQQRVRAAAILAAANLAAAKLAVKLGDPSLAWVAADRAARVAADQAQDDVLVAAAVFSVGTALLAMPNRVDDAEDVVLSALDRIKRVPVSTRPRALSAHGALALLAALIGARQARPTAAERHLDDADALARRLGGDRNDLWTGFGPTNVMIHRISIAVRTDQPRLAIHLGERIDTSSLPAALVSRRARVHLDLAAAHACSPDNDPAAVLHLLEAERLAPQTVHTHGRTRRLISDLLARERRAVTPGLRALAERAEVSV